MKKNTIIYTYRKRVELMAPLKNYKSLNDLIIKYSGVK